MNRTQSNPECRLGAVEYYHEPCSENLYYLHACFPGSKKSAQCVGEDSQYNCCVPCKHNHYLDFYNNCTSCIPCTVCNSSQYASRMCTHELNTVCKTLPLTTTMSPEQSDAVSSSSAHLLSSSVQPPDPTSPIHKYDGGGTTACSSVPSMLSSLKPMIGAMTLLCFSFIH